MVRYGGYTLPYTNRTQNFLERDDLLHPDPHHMNSNSNCMNSNLQHLLLRCGWLHRCLRITYDPVNSNRKSADEPPPNINLRTHSSGRRCCWNRVALRDSLIFPERNYWELEGDLLATSSAMLTEIPTLERLCQEVLANEAAKYGSKKINELCKRIPSHLLESILQSLLDRNQVTDVALNMFLVPSRTNLVMNGFCKIKNSTFKQIGYSCPNLVRFRLILVRINLRTSNNIIKF